MARVQGAIRVLVGLLALAVATPGAALAYTAAGDRQFPATLLLPQIAPGDETYANFSSLPLQGGPTGSQSYNNGFTTVVAKTITDNFGIYIDETYTRIGRVGKETISGFQNFDTELKYLAYSNREHEFILSLGLDREFGGTGMQGVNASSSGATTPRVYFGKGLGDLDIGYLRPLAISGYAGVQVADKAPRPDLVTSGFVLEYSIPYLQAKVESLDLPDLLRGLTPMTEVLVTTPAGRSFGARTTVLIGPGVSFAGNGWEFGIEAQIPMTNATGKGVGIIAQMHLALDFLFPDTIGKPIFSER
jgi:hypothetical protein